MIDPNKIELDLDRERIRTVLTEAYTTCKNFLGVEFDMTRERFVGQVDPFLKSNRVTIPIFLNLPSRKHPGMKIRVDLRRGKVMAYLFPKSKQALLNHMLGAL